MTEVLLISETMVKSVSSISENLAGKFLRPSILEAQEVGLKHVLGAPLTEKLKEMVLLGTLEGSYKALLDACQYYLAYQSVVELIPRVSYKINNAGMNTTTDEHIHQTTWDDIMGMRSFYQAKADQYCLDLQRWVLKHYDDFPELQDSECYEVRQNLISAASCGVWLGGLRGQKI